MRGDERGSARGRLGGGNRGYKKRLPTSNEHAGDCETLGDDPPATEEQGFEENRGPREQERKTKSIFTDLGQMPEDRSGGGGGDAAAVRRRRRERAARVSAWRNDCS